MEDRSRQAVDRFARDLGHQLQAFAFAMLDAPLHQLAEARRVRPAVELQHDPVEEHAEVSLVQDAVQARTVRDEAQAGDMWEMRAEGRHRRLLLPSARIEGE